MKKRKKLLNGKKRLGIAVLAMVMASASISTVLPNAYADENTENEQKVNSEMQTETTTDDSNGKDPAKDTKGDEDKTDMEKKDPADDKECDNKKSERGKDVDQQCPQVIKNNKQKVKKAVVKAAGDISIDEAHFPDAEFRAMVSYQYDTNRDGILQESEKATRGGITIDGNIQDISGIEYLGKFAWLTVESPIKNLDLRKCSSIKKLEIGEEVGMTEIDMNNIPYVDDLWIYDQYASNINPIKEIKHLKESNIATLRVDKSEIESLDLSGSNSIKTITVVGTGLGNGDVHSNKLRELKVDKCPNLEDIKCNGTYLQELDVTGSPKLYEIEIMNADVSSLDLSNNPQLECIYVNGTEITNLDLSGKTKLQTLDCSYSHVRGLDLKASAANQWDELLAEKCNFAFLNLGDNFKTPDIDFIVPKKSHFIMEVYEDYFDIASIFPGIDTSKIKILSGGKIDGNTISEYGKDGEVVYEYDCGKVDGRPTKMEVTLTLSTKERPAQPPTNPSDPANPDGSDHNGNTDGSINNNGTGKPAKTTAKTTEKETVKVTSVPKTGDSTELIFLTSVLAISAAALYMLLFVNKKSKREKNNE